MPVDGSHGYGGGRFEVHDDRSPFGHPGGLAMTGQVRNWASFETPNGKPMFRMKSQPDPDFTPPHGRFLLRR